ncbi:unnamed protein product, partial [Effrenium voratum]
VTSEQNIGEWLNARFFKAQYTHHENPADFFYESLRLGQETAEKQQPSALEFVGQFRQAVEIHNATTGKKLPLTQSLNHVVGAYNARSDENSSSESSPDDNGRNLGNATLDFFRLGGRKLMDSWLAEQKSPPNARGSKMHPCLPPLFARRIWTSNSSKTKCWKSITVRDLQDICNFFWSLAKPAQDALLWSMQCREGKRTAARPALASESVSVFMQKMYYSISETMPTGILPNNIELNSEEARATLLQQLMNQALEGPTTRLTHRDPRLLAKRELPPGSWSSMYLVYQAHCLACGTRPASRAVFYEDTKRWRHCLKFRSKSQHSTCLQCDRLRAQMRHSKSFMEHAAAADRLLGHLATTCDAGRPTGPRGNNPGAKRALSASS